MSLRERKRERTRQALIEAATDLFEERGYDGTTVADIAAAADIGTRTFFSYFASKEDLLLPDADHRVRAALDAIATRRPDEQPMDVLLRALGDVLAGPTPGVVDRLAGLRRQLFRDEPAVRGKLLVVQHQAHVEIGEALAAAFPELGRAVAHASVGAFLGAIQGTIEVLLDGSAPPGDPVELRDRLEQVTRSVLRP